jgi:hypothetical protein
MKHLFLIGILAIQYYSVRPQNYVQKDFSSIYKSFAAAFIYNDSLYSYDSDFHLFKDSARHLRHDSSMLNNLVNTYSSTTIYSVDQNGNLSIFGNSAALAKSTYKVIYEFSQTQPVKKQFAGDTARVIAVGISVRMVATLYTLKGSVDLSKITNFITASASKNKLDGFLEVKVSGISSKTIKSLIPTPTTISPESIIAALQAMAAIKSHFSDSDVRVIPEIVGYYEISDRIDGIVAGQFQFQSR